MPLTIVPLLAVFPPCIWNGGQYLQKTQLLSTYYPDLHNKMLGGLRDVALELCRHPYHDLGTHATSPNLLNLKLPPSPSRMPFNCLNHCPALNIPKLQHPLMATAD